MAEIHRLRRPHAPELRYPSEPDRTGALIGHLVVGVSGLVVGWLFGSLDWVAEATCNALLAALPW